MLPATASLLAFLGRLHWTLELLSHFRPHYAVSLALAALTLLFARRVRFAALFGALALVNFAPIAPWYVPWKRASTSPIEIRLLFSNVHTSNHGEDRLLNLIAHEDPDIVVLVEVSKRWLQNLDQLRSAYQYYVHEPRSDNFGIALYSRIPFENARTISLGKASVPSIVAEFTESEGSFTLIGTHPLPPISAEYAEKRNNQFKALSDTVQGIQGSVILVGDLNATPWSPYYRGLRIESGLKDSSVGRGPQPTWPSEFGILGIPLDHCLHTPNFQIVSRRVGEGIGSDHFPVVLDLIRMKEGHR